MVLRERVSSLVATRVIVDVHDRSVNADFMRLALSAMHSVDATRSEDMPSLESTVADSSFV